MDMDTKAQAEQNLIVRCLTGSRAYGTSNAHSDVDIRGVFAAQPLSVMVPFSPIEQWKGEGDTVLFELFKYVRLVCDQNPNIVELLWVHPEDELYASPAWRLLHGMREQLLTTRVRATYGGFAAQALKGIKGHDRWLNNPQPQQAPVPSDFVGMVYNLGLGREFNKRVPRDGQWTAVGVGHDLYALYQGGNGGSWVRDDGGIRSYSREDAAAIIDGQQPAAFASFNRKGYEERKRDHENYWNWQRNRNPDRGALEASLGYDAKNAGHLIRLLRTAREILVEGIVRVRRPDAAELLAIRSGEISYERVLAMAEEIEVQLPALQAASSLPASIDQAVVADVVMQMYEMTWRAAAGRTHVAMPQQPFLGGRVPDVRGRVVVVDLEMTGYSDVGRKQIVEIGMVEIMGGRRTGRTLHAYVDPEAKISHFAQRVHGLSREFLAGKPTFAEMIPQVMEFLGDSPIVAHNAAGDIRALNNDLLLSNHAPIEPGRTACTVRLARQLLDVDEASLDTLCDILQVDRTPRQRGHSAALDASLLADCLLVMADMPDYGSTRIRDVWLQGNLVNTRAQRRDISRERARKTGCLRVDISPDGLHAVFRMADGTALSEPLPPYPSDTHRGVALSRNAAAIVRRDDEMTPDNPLGTSMVVYQRGVVQHRTPRVDQGLKPAMADATARQGSSAPGMG